MSALFDTHAHLQDEAFDGSEFDAVVARAEAAGVVGIALCGYDRESNAAALRLAARSQLVHPTVGYHPHEAKTVTTAMLDELAVQVLLPEVVAVGEIGLDFYRDHSPHAAQRGALEAQLTIALAAGKPVCVHSRGAEDAIYEQLAAYASATPPRPPQWERGSGGAGPGVMHCFGGTLEQALRYVELGFMVSLACVVTFPKNEEARRLAAGLPLEALVIETDSPYLPPQHLRGQRNEPANVAAAARAIAEARGLSFEAVADATTANACRLYGVRVRELAGAR